jgi:ATP-dependent exoDNAse (exonuclease V) beta subunit
MIRPSELVERMIDDLDYQAYLAAEDRTGRKTANLRKLIITARSLDQAGISLRELIRMFKRVGLDDEEQASIESEETDAVKIMTVHKAKGLEFPLVIVGDTSWSAKDSAETLLFSKDEDGICFTLCCEDDSEGETLLGRLISEEQDRDLEEEKRSLYVATTRASDMLVLTFSGKKGRGSQPWRDLLLGGLVELREEGIALVPGFEDLMEIVHAPEAEPPPQDGASASSSLDMKYIAPVSSEAFKEYVSPTALMETMRPGWTVTLAEPEDVEDGAGEVRELGNLAHQILEVVGPSARLGELASCEEPWVPLEKGFTGFEEAQVRQVWKYLDRLKDHPLMKEMESALESRDEYPIARPFGKYILYGRPDKLIRTREGWKILDFKFSRSDSHSEAYEFQMRFYLYLAREIFSPLIGAELLYLKDGSTNHITLDEKEIETFKEELKSKIEKYQEALGRSLCEEGRQEYAK